MTKKEKKSAYADSRRKLSKLGEEQLQKTLCDPNRVEQERLFAEKHGKDSDRELLLYVKERKNKTGKRFKRKDLIGYSYLLERFGSWEKVITPVNEMLKQEKEDLKRKEKEES